MSPWKGEKETHAPSAWEIIENEAAAASNVVKTQYSLVRFVKCNLPLSRQIHPSISPFFVGKVRRPMSRKKGALDLDLSIRHDAKRTGCIQLFLTRI